MALIQNTKCECGHQNPPGTVLCEACGKPLDEELAASDSVLEMRYDGMARRSQKSRPNPIDRVWNFFSSVKVAVWLIITTLVAASLGTIFPQESAFVNLTDPAGYYRETYGTAGAIYYALGLSRTYESWWFITLLVMIGASLVICSLDRVLPLYRALTRQQVRKHLQFITRQQVVYVGPIEGDPGAWTVKFAEILRRRRFKVRTDGTALLAEKNRFSRWGPYVLHIGLIVFLLAVLSRGIPGWYMDEYVGLDDGELEQIPQTKYFVKSLGFSIELYSDEEMPEHLKGELRPKQFITKAVLYECVAWCDDVTRQPELREVASHDIRVNSPLSYRGLRLYQYDFAESPRLISVRPVLVDKRTGESYGPFELPMRHPPLTYSAGPFTLELRDSFPEFGLDENGEPVTLSREPNAPAFVFVIKGPGLPEEGVPYLYFPREADRQRFGQDRINGEAAELFEIRVQSMEDVEFSTYTSYLNVRVDRGMPYVWTGAAICMIGLLMGIYWNHRRIWLRIDDGVLSLGAHTNKNTFGLRAEVAAALAKAGIVVEAKSLDNRRKET
jgi:cytochrome c biogenesis protein